MPSFIEAPFPTKVAYSEWQHLPESEQSAALAEAAALYAPRPPQQLVEQESSVFAKVLETQELVQLIVSSLQLADVALVALARWHASGAITD